MAFFLGLLVFFSHLSILCAEESNGLILHRLNDSHLGVQLEIGFKRASDFQVFELRPFYLKLEERAPQVLKDWMEEGHGEFERFEVVGFGVDPVFGTYAYIGTRRNRRLDVRVYVNHPRVVFTHSGVVLETELTRYDSPKTARERIEGKVYRFQGDLPSGGSLNLLASERMPTDDQKLMLWFDRLIYTRSDGAREVYFGLSDFPEAAAEGSFEMTIKGAFAEDWGKGVTSVEAKGFEGGSLFSGSDVAAIVNYGDPRGFTLLLKDAEGKTFELTLYMLDQGGVELSFEGVTIPKVRVSSVEGSSVPDLCHQVLTELESSE